MNWKRNTTGLKVAAQKKRLNAFAKTEAAIKQLLQQRQPITFEAVAERAGVTRAWLYKQPDLKERITYLREQSMPKPPKSRRASENSKDAIILTLRRQVKDLRQQADQLNQQLEVAYGLASESLSKGLTSGPQQKSSDVEQLQAMLNQALKDNLSLTQENQKLQSQLSVLEALEAENAELTKQNKHLFNKVVQLQSVEKELTEYRSDHESRSTNLLELPEVEF